MLLFAGAQRINVQKAHRGFVAKAPAVREKNPAPWKPLKACSLCKRPVLCDAYKNCPCSGQDDAFTAYPVVLLYAFGSSAMYIPGGRSSFQIGLGMMCRRVHFCRPYELARINAFTSIKDHGKTAECLGMQYEAVNVRFLRTVVMPFLLLTVFLRLLHLPASSHSISTRSRIHTLMPCCSYSRCPSGEGFFPLLAGTCSNTSERLAGQKRDRTEFVLDSRRLGF